MKFPKGIRKVRRPKMRNHRGRTWDLCDVILPDGTKVEGHLDTTWGTRFYFVHGGFWWSGSLDDFEARGARASVYAVYRADLRQEAAA